MSYIAIDDFLPGSENDMCILVDPHADANLSFKQSPYN